MIGAHVTEALCQDCLRIVPKDRLLPSDNQPPGLCPSCQGQTCDCPSCMAEAQVLRSGDLNSVGLVAGHRLAAWSPETGGIIVRQTEA